MFMFVQYATNDRNRFSNRQIHLNAHAVQRQRQDVRKAGFRHMLFHRGYNMAEYGYGSSVRNHSGRKRFTCGHKNGSTERETFSC